MVKKNPLALRGSLLKASFLHDDDWDPTEELSSSGHVEVDASARNKSTNNNCAAAPSINSSNSRSHSKDDDDDSYSSSSSSSSIFGYGFNSVARQASLSTIQDSAAEPNKEETPHELAAHVAQRVKSNFYKNLPESLLEDYERKDCIAPFKTTEIVLGPLLGSGEFSHVYEIKGFRPQLSSESTLDASQIKTRKHLKSRERYHDTKKACYAVKHLRPDLVERYETLEYVQSAKDLAMEAEFLSSLQHPNIIKLRGISFEGAGGFARGPKGYFLIIDRLNETLDGRIKRWRRAKRKERVGGLLSSSWKSKLHPRALAGAGVAAGKKHIYNNTSKGDKDGNATATTASTESGDQDKKHQQKGDDKNGGNQPKKSLISEEQVDVGLQIASALMYLHEKSIMFRDLKPQNVGFDVRGDVKLFDFGLATVMPPFGDPYEEKFNMSGAGSPRYMAPEVLIDPPERYNMKADVYTFGIVLWEIFSLESPFSFVRKRDELVEFVLDQDGRPTINESWPEPIKELLRLSFDADMDKRPSIQLHYNTLRFQLLNLRDGDDTRLDNAFIKRRRSFGSLRHLDMHNDEEQQSTVEKFPMRVKNTILNHVKSPPSSSDGDNQAQPRRRRNKLREKVGLLRLSVKHEE